METSSFEANGTIEAVASKEDYNSFIFVYNFGNWLLYTPFEFCDKQDAEDILGYMNKRELEQPSKMKFNEDGTGLFYYRLKDNRNDDAQEMSRGIKSNPTMDISKRWNRLTPIHQIVKENTLHATLDVVETRFRKQSDRNMGHDNLYI